MGVIALPHTSGPGVVVGGVADQCPTCVGLKNAQHWAWATADHSAGARAACAFHRHWVTHHESRAPSVEG